MKRSTLSYANSRRGYRIFEEFNYSLLKTFDGKLRVRFPKFMRRPVFSLDSTTITVCMSLFSWAKYRSTKGGIKLHTVLNHELLLPTVAVMTDGKVADVKMAKDTIERLPAESFVIMDRGYNNNDLFMWLCGRGTRFVTRLKDNAWTSALREGLRSQKPNFWGGYQFTFTGLKAQEICDDTSSVASSGMTSIMIVGLTSLLPY